MHTIQTESLYVIDLQEDKMAGVTGLEPATSAVTGQRSNQLSYTPEEEPNVREIRNPSQQ